ncbi:MAG: neutral/alkaline non-lysosomal ceramidase N-terminal domain-containing protein, partial [Cystobacterineae bacterium]|nr:neutral/alkaline non-lysosomal ceramidase N-terminal domain-containing protein [Cystobacterineae bacterium]
MPKNLRRSSSSQLETGLSPFRRHRLWMLVVLLLGGLYALASLPLCPQGPPSPPRLLSSQTAATPLEVGAAKAEIRVPRWPIVIAGYGPPRSEAMEQTLPLYARAVVLKAEGFELSLLSVDILMVSGGFVDILRQRLGGEVWTVPTHSHSSLGGVDERWQAQIAAMGRFDEAAQQALLQACLEAVEEARKNLRAARFAWEESTPEDWTRPRSGTQVDRRLLRLRWQDEAGPIAQILLLSGHPTLVRAKATQLNPDYPGELALLEESAGRGLTLVWPSAVANARISLEEASPQTVALTLHKHLQAWLPPNPYPTSPPPRPPLQAPAPPPTSPPRALPPP